MRNHFYNPRTLVSDLRAGLLIGIVTIPDSLAAGFLAAINPMHAVYAAMLSIPVGAVFTSSVYMSVQTTSAMSLIVASVPQVHLPGAGVGYLLALTLLTGLIFPPISARRKQLGLPGRPVQKSFFLLTCILPATFSTWRKSAGIYFPVRSSGGKTGYAWKFRLQVGKYDPERLMESRTGRNVGIFPPEGK